MSEPPSSPPNAQTSIEDALAWYKAQYELLEQELSEFQASSRELEAELEKDLDAAEKREQALRRKAEGLSYEVEEWKVCRLYFSVLSYFLFFERACARGGLADNDLFLPHFLFPCRENTGSQSRRRTRRRTR